MGIKAVGEVTWPIMRPIREVVRKIAMGSLLPDSSSRSGLRSPFRLICLDRRMEKTAAASVEEMMAAKSMASSMVKSRT